VITLAVVVRDEAALLDDCLASSRGAFEEIVVVDHGSKDDSAGVARAHGARVLASDAASHELARNAYLEAATMPWILVLDADERLASPSQVRAVVERARPDVGGFALERFDYTGEGRWASTRLVRLFRRDPRVRYFASLAHAAVAPSIADAGGTIALATAAIHHLDALLPRDHEAKRAHMRARLERATASPSAPAILSCFLALEWFAVGDEERGESALSRALSRDARCEPIVTLFRAQRHRVHGRWAEAADGAARVLSLPSARFRGRTSAHAVLADALAQLGRRADALAAVRAAIAEEPDVASHRWNLGALLGDGDEADAARRAAEQRNPWLADARIRGAGARPSIFVQQDALVGRRS
jgi:tetratricopeptide (TPR) repeat protein